jgi:1-phosphatidylinositol phosphodiesterase
MLAMAASATPLDNSWDLSSVAGKPVVVQASGAATFNGISNDQRAYLRTARSDFANTSFVAEISVTVNNGGGLGSAFVGLGAGQPSSGYYYEPQTAPANYLRLAPSDFGSGYLSFNDNSTFTAITSSGPGNGTHRVRLIWDANRHRLQTDVDTNYAGGIFVRDYGRANFSAGTGFTAGNSCIFVGGAGGVSFGPLTLRPATATDLALIDVGPTRWMSALDGSVPLSQLTIPGTHESSARVETWPATAICQSLSIADQLNAGIRYLDFRCCHLNDSFEIYHGSIDQNISYDAVLSQVYNFLNANPDECVMMVVKEEGTASGDTRTFEQTFDAYVAANPGRWWLGTYIPTLDEVRGKIVLVRRFGASTAMGINATYWPDNTGFSANGLVVEDHYVVNDNNTKWGYVTAGLNAAAADSNPANLYLTHSSGYAPQTFGIPNIPDVSNDLNPRIYSWFTGVKPGHYGCLIVDYADTSFPWLIAQANFLRPGPVPDGVYQVTAKHSGSVLDVTGASTAPATPVQQWQWGGGNNQRWTFANLGAGLYRITALHSGQALDVDSSSTTNGAQVLQYYVTGNLNQSWQAVANGDGSYRLVNQNSGLVLDVWNGSGANGAKVEQWSWNGGDNQRWLLQPVNRAPAFNPNPPTPLTVCVGGTLAGTLTASDPDPGQLPIQFAAAGAPAWFSVSPAGAVSGTPPPEAQGATNVTVLAGDPYGAVSSAILDLTILGAPAWTNTAGGVWSQAANWRSGLVGGIASASADFSTLALLQNTTVTLDAARSVNRLDFADTAATHDWTLAGSAALSLIGPGSPVIQVSNRAATFSVPLTGASGLTKSGAGTLTLSGANTYSGMTSNLNGRLVFSGNAGGSSSVFIAANSTVEFAVASGLRDEGNVTYTGVGTLRKSGGGTLRWPAVTGTFALGAGALIDVQGGTFDAGSNADEDWTGNRSSLNVAAGASIVELAYNPSVFDALTGSGSVALNGSSTMSLGANGTAAGTYNAAGTATFSGVITSSGGLMKVGAGTQILTGANTYTGPTTVSGGTLLVNGSLASASAVTVGAGVTLGGTGRIWGPVTLQSGGLLMAGTPAALGTLSIPNILTLNSGSTNLMRLRKTGGVRTSDMVRDLTGTLNYAGTLVVSNVTSDGTPLAAGDVFGLFIKGSGGYGGSFATLVLPPLADGLGWDVSRLTVNGTIAVATAPPMPTFNPPAGDYLGVQAVTLSCSSPGATIYYTTNGSAPGTGSASGSSGLTVSVPANGIVTIKAFARVAGLADSAVASATYVTIPPGVWTNLAGGSWPVTGNWSNGVVATGSSVTADFSTLNLTADATVTLDGDRVIGKLVFGDTTADHNWALNSGTGGTLTLDRALPPTILVRNQAASIGAAVAGTKGLTKAGAGTLTLTSSSNFYSGGTVVSQGQLNLEGTVAGNAAGVGPIILGDAATGAGGATVGLKGATVWGPNIWSTNDILVAAGPTNRLVLTRDGGTYAAVFRGTITLSNDVVLRNDSGDRLAIEGKITGRGNVTIETTGPRVNLDNTNDFIGNVTVTAGSFLQLNGSGCVPATADVTANGQVGFNSDSLSALAIGGLNGSGAVTRPWGANLCMLTVGSGGRSGNFSGALQSGLALTKTGSGTQVLAGTNSYTGPTVVSNGVLLVNGSLASGSAVLVNAGASLGGGGAVNGLVTVNGLMAPGTGVGTLSTGAEIWNGGGGYVCEINATNGAGCDLLNIAGALDVEATAGSPFTIRVVSLSASNTPGALTGFDSGGNYLWTIATASGGITSFNAGKFVLDTAAFGNAYAGQFAITNIGNTLALAYAGAALPPITSGGQVTDGVFQLTVSGTAGQRFTIQGTNDLSVPLGAWPILTNGALDGSGQVLLSDPGVLTNGCWFYRVTSP